MEQRDLPPRLCRYHGKVLQTKEVTRIKIAIAVGGYVGPSNGVLLAQCHEVVVIDVVPEKVAMLNRKESLIIDSELEDYLTSKPLN